MMNKLLKFPSNKLPKAKLAVEYEIDKRNLLKYSEDLTNAAWIKSYATCQSNLITESTDASTTHRIEIYHPSITGISYTFYTDVKSNGKNYIALGVYSGSFGLRHAYFNLATGQLGTVSPNLLNATITSLGEGVYRCAVTWTATDTALTEVLLSLCSDTPSTSYTGDGISGVYVYRAQVNRGLVALPYERTWDNQTLWNSVLTNKIVKNAAIDGNFANGGVGWTSYIGGTISVVDGVLSHTGNGDSASPAVQILHLIRYASSKKIYIAAKYKVTSSGCVQLVATAKSTGMTDIGANPQTSPAQNTQYTRGVILTLGAGGTPGGSLQIVLRHQWADAATANGKVMELEDVMVLDLTAIFGSGNEPTEAQCDQMFATWFADTASSIDVTPVNMLSNGNFAVTSGWDSQAMASFSVANNEATTLANAQGDYFYQPKASIPGHVYYYSINVKATSAQVRTTYLWTTYTKFHSGSGNYERLSFVGTATTTICNPGVYDNRTSGWDNIYAKEAMFIDLTALFGDLANSLTASMCDALFSTWFDGTGSEVPCHIMPLPLYNGILGSTTAGDTAEPTWSGQGLDFGGDDYVGIGYPMVGKPCSVFVAFNPYSSNTETLFAFNVSGGYRIMHGTTGSTGYLTLVKCGTGTIATGATAFATDINAVPHFGGFTVDDNYLCKVYLDNKQDAEGTTSAIAATTGITLGRRVDSTGEYMTGKLYHTVIYNGCLSPSKVKQLKRYVKKQLAKREVPLSA